MRLEELVGKKAVRTQPVWYNDNNEPIEERTCDKDFDDDSYTNGKYITVLEIKSYGIRYYQHFNPSSERTFVFHKPYDQGFMDDNWEEFKEA